MIVVRQPEQLARRPDLGALAEAEIQSEDRVRLAVEGDNEELPAIVAEEEFERCSAGRDPLHSRRRLGLLRP